MNDICTCWVQSVRDKSHPQLHAPDCYLFPPQGRGACHGDPCVCESPSSDGGVA